ncbi:MAG: M16 family metallopeptidase, partial [Cyclobacteriaceae bacterium]
MRLVYFLSTLIFIGSAALAQVDRSKAPAPKPAREIKIGEYQSFTLKNGLQVFVVENHKLPRLQISIQLLHDPILEGDKAGYVSLAGDLIGTGTTSRSKSQLDEEVDFIGASLSTGPYSMYGSSLTKHTEKLLELFTDVLFHPAFRPEELDKLKTQTISGIAAGKDNPQTIAANVRNMLMYGKDHPYGEMSTEETVGAVTIEDCRNYFDTYYKPNNAYLVLVGDISLKNAKSLAEKNFGAWKSGEIKPLTYHTPKVPQKTYVALVDRPSSVQSVINIAHPISLSVGSPDALKAGVMNEILGGSSSARLYLNLRETHGYTYGAGSQISSDRLVGRFIASASVRNEVTDSAVYEMMSELKRIVSEPVSSEELKAAKASIAGSFGRSLERPQTIASFAVNTARYNLPKDYYSSYLQRLDAVSVEDIQSVAAKYIQPDHAYIEVVGKGSDVAEKLKPFGEVKYYDIHGNEYVPKESQPLPPGLTAEKVIDKYLSALGGRQKIEKVQTVKLTYKANA